MSEKLIITLEFEGSEFLKYDVKCTDPKRLKRLSNGREYYFELDDWGADKLRIEHYQADYSDNAEIKGGNNWCLQQLAILFTAIFKEDAVPLKQKCTLSKRSNFFKMKKSGFDFNSEWVE